MTIALDLLVSFDTAKQEMAIDAMINSLSSYRNINKLEISRTYNKLL